MRAKYFGCHFVCVTLEFHFEAVRKQECAFYSRRSEKVCFSCLVVSKEASVAQKANEVKKCLERITGASIVLEKDSRRVI